MIRDIYIFCYLPGQPVAIPAGLFTHDSARAIGTFAYGRRYQNRPDAISIDPTVLPLGLPTYPAAIYNDGLYGVFRDASPDLWGREVYAHKMQVPSESLSSIDYLLASNATRVGNLDFRDSPESPEPDYAPPEFSEIEPLLEAAEAIEQEGNSAVKQNNRALIDLLVQGTSIGGARPKATLRYQGDLWIAKFPARNDAYSHARTEYASMKLAGLCGIRIPELSVIDVSGRDVMLSKRFDRSKHPAGFTRLGYISALTVLDVDERDRGMWSYQLLADRMRQITIRDDLKELYKRIIFNILIRNTDDHPRNHGFLFMGGKWRLSPAFDITPTRSTPGLGIEFNLAMSLGPLGKLASIENILADGERFGFSRKAEAEDLIYSMCEIVKKWRDIFAEHGVSDEEAEMFAWGFDNPDSPLNHGLRLAGSDRAKPY